MNAQVSARKGLILAGGTGSRLWPVTLGVSKQLLPIHDKPMIYYPLSVLMLSDIREIAIVTTAKDNAQFKELLGDGSQWGLSIEYIVQNAPDGLSQAFILAEKFLAGSPSALVLGDNIFFGNGLAKQLKRVSAQTDTATIFGYQVSDPSSYGVIGFDADGNPDSLTEKPESPASHYAITGLYYVDGSAPERAKAIKPSARGELEITDLLFSYLKEKRLNVEMMGRGYAWLDTGTHESLLDAGNFVRTLQLRQGLQVGSPDEIAYEQDWISQEEFECRAELFIKSDYGTALRRILNR